MAVITLSRQTGSGGNEIVDLICQATGYRLFDKHILAKAASDSGLSEQEVIDFSEENYKATTFFDRLFHPSRPVAQVRVWRDTADGTRTMEAVQLSEEYALAFVQRAVETAYKIGNIVIVGRGGQVILKDRPDVIHIRVEALVEDRIRRLRESPKLTKTNRSFENSVEIRRTAQDIINANDDASADYLKRFYGVDWSDPMLYHLIINTSKMDIEKAAHLVVEAIHQSERTPEPA